MGERTGVELEGEARADFEVVADDPQRRLAFAERFYLASDRGGVHRYGECELDFMRWELRRGVLDPLDSSDHPGSPWWRAVNGRLLVDAHEAFLRTEDHLPEGASGPVRAWLSFLADPSPASWYRAHNSSIVRGYLDAAELARSEDGWEQKLMNLVLYRVLFTQAVVDQQAWASLGLGRIAAAFCDPSSPFVPSVLKDQSFYPDSYPLDARDRRRLERRFDHFGNLPVALVDLVFIRTRLDRLYAYMAEALGFEELRRMCCESQTTYPWCFDLNGNEIVSVRIADDPGIGLQLLGKIVDLF
ncbi:MAG TPA: hypothetical protein VKU92_05375 [Acidimicrobiales bacterium]|nr:hypothetical protein [Acidimicrobiales bacterium]